jgi:predicted transcriptional regulator
MEGMIVMETPKVFESEYRFCEILWENEPVSSSELVRLCNEKLEWKKSTTYTVIRRLAERGVLKNEDSIVTSLVSKEDIQSAESEEVVERTFSGSLPNFIAAFTRKKNLSKQEIDEIQNIIDKYKN